MPDITERQIYDALGIGEKEQAPAEPAPEDEAAGTETGENAQEPADPAGAAAAQDPEPEGAEAPEGGDGDDPEAGETGETDAEDGKPQTPEQRKENAERRRKREQERQLAIDRAVQAAVQAEQEKAQASMAEFFAGANLTNSLTGAPITNMAEFRAWKEEFERARLERELKAGKLTPEGLSKAISDNPAVKAAQAVIQKNDEETRQRGLAEARARADADLAEIRKLDPTVKDMGDLLKMPNAKDFYAYVKKGNSFLDAFYLANRERLASASAEAAKQRALNNARSKDHLTATAVRGGGAISVPADELALFREFMPGASEADIQAYYKKYKSP
jgi:hypothetical protein